MTTAIPGSCSEVTPHALHMDRSFRPARVCPGVPGDDPRYCTVCGVELVTRYWGLPEREPHTDEYHVKRREDLLRRVHQITVRRLAVDAGHHITIRFAGQQCWFECAWGLRGTTFLRDTGLARNEAKAHLYEIGLGMGKL